MNKSVPDARPTALEGIVATGSCSPWAASACAAFREALIAALRDCRPRT